MLHQRHVLIAKKLSQSELLFLRCGVPITSNLPWAPVWRSSNLYQFTTGVYHPHDVIGTHIRLCVTHYCGKMATAKESNEGWCTHLS